LKFLDCKNILKFYNKLFSFFSEFSKNKLLKSSVEKFFQKKNCENPESVDDSHLKIFGIEK